VSFFNEIAVSKKLLADFTRLMSFLVSFQKYSISLLYFACSAGAGQTGTFIAFENLLHEMKQTNKFDPMKAVLKMRENRKDMVQNKVTLFANK